MPRRKKSSITAEFQIAPMIDCVFLLLIYFIMTSSLKRQESDLSFQLPGTVEQEQTLDIPDEQVIEIRTDGSVVVNDFPFGSIDEDRLSALAAMLSRFKEACEANRSTARVTIHPAPCTPHAGVVKILDACSLAGIQSVNFSLGEDIL